MYSAMLHETHLTALRHAPCLMGSQELSATHTFYTRNGTATTVKIHPQSSTAVTHCLLITTHFTDPPKDDSLCQARECHRELNPGRWRQRQVCYNTATCFRKK